MQSQPYNDSPQVPFEPSPQASGASPALWLSAIVASAFYFGANVITAPEGARDGAEQAGQIFGKMLGTFLLPMIFVGIASAWRNNRTQRRRVTVFLVATLALLGLQVVTPFLMRAAAGAANSGPPWEYRSPEHGFSLVLPSSGWRKSEKPKHLADFWFAGLSPMLAGVMSVEKQSSEEFQASASTLERSLQGRPKRDAPPKLESGATPSGGRYVLATWDENAGPRGEKVHVAMARVWLSDKGTTVSILYEGRSKMLSESGRAIEEAELAKAAKAITLSVK